MNNLLTEKYGVIPSDNKNNYQLSNCTTIIDNFPNKYEYEYPDIVYNQNEGKMCVPCSISLMRFIQKYKSTGNFVIPDPLSLYTFRDEDMYNGDGMKPRECLDILAKHNICTLNKSKFEMFNCIYANYSYESAVNYFKTNDYNISDYFKIKSYYSVHNINEIKCAIINFHAVSAMIPMYMCFKYPKKVKGIKHDEYYANFDVDFMRIEPGYYHQITIVGWIKNYWIVQNSWGNKFGYKGKVYMSFEYPILEAWTCIDNYNSDIFGIVSNNKDIQTTT